MLINYLIKRKLYVWTQRDVNFGGKTINKSKLSKLRFRISRKTQFLLANYLEIIMGSK